MMISCPTDWRQWHRHTGDSGWWRSVLSWGKFFGDCAKAIYTRIIKVLKPTIIGAQRPPTIKQKGKTSQWQWHWAWEAWSPERNVQHCEVWFKPGKQDRIEDESGFGRQVAVELCHIKDPILKTRAKKRIMTKLHEYQEADQDLTGRAQQWAKSNDQFNI